MPSFLKSPKTLVAPLLFFLLPNEQVSAPISPPISGDNARWLRLAAGPVALERGYGLGVVDLPPVPEMVSGGDSQLPLDCPVEVRAIVTAENPADSFAVLAWGEESTLLAPGQGVRTSRGWLALKSIGPDWVEVRDRERTFRCALRAEGEPAAAQSGAIP